MKQPICGSQSSLCAVLYTWGQINKSCFVMEYNGEVLCCESPRKIKNGNVLKIVILETWVNACASSKFV